MKIRIFALAKELGLDSKVLIDHANNAGVSIKNSALASISPEERDVIVQHIKQPESSDDSASIGQSFAPVRERPATVGGKVRALRTALSGSVSTRRAMVKTAESADDALSTAVAEASAEAAVAPAADRDMTAVDQVVEAAASATETVVTKSDETEESTGTKPVAEATTTPADAPMTRDEYVPSSGVSGSTIREMKPRGTIFDGGSGKGRQPRERPKSVLPNLAAPPKYKQPKVKKPASSEGPAQKPDMKLTPDILENQSPLSAHLRKHAEQKEKQKKFGEKLPVALKSKAQREAEEQQLRRPRQRRRRSGRDDGYEGRSRFSGRRRQKRQGPVVYQTSAEIQLPITLRGLSEALGRPARDLIRILFDKGELVNINDNITEETALELALELGVDLKIKRGRDLEEELAAALETTDPPETLQPRPPIVTILGHVDHGKTTLLDKIRSANVAEGEAGGITQHIAAYQVERNGQKLTFVDTPGHAAFSEMRARGANVTDIVVLVAAADDGVMPQTVESISHAKAAGVPMVVAMNKIDLPDINPDKVLQQLAAHEVLSPAWGGDTEVVRTSALTGEGLDELIETLLVTAELQEFRANPDRPAVGVCLEGFRDEGRGSLAWLIVQNGTLRVGDVVLCGVAFGRIRAMYNDRGEEVEQADPSMPVKVAGLDTVPGAGDHFFVMSDIEEARRVSEARRDTGRTEQLAGRGRPRTLEDILVAARGGKVQDLPLIIKADTPGSLEALRGEIHKFEHPEVRVIIVHEGIGGINESDVYLASASGAIVIAFHVVPEDRARTLARSEGIEIRRFNIIYEVTETIKRSLEGLLEPERIEVSAGRALVLQTFHISRYGTIAGCRILSGTIERSNRVHVIRDQTVLNDYNIASLKREKDDVREVREGMECGIRLEGFNDVKEGDLLEAFREEKRKRTLDST